MRIYVGNLNFRTDAEMLRDVFSEYGEVSDVHVVMDRETGRSRGFGFVEMTNDEEAEAAMKALNGAEVDGRTLTVNQARERTEGGGGGGGRGGFRGGRGGGGGRGGYGGGGGRGGRRDEW